jgi:hypothetical protein
VIRRQRQRLNSRLDCDMSVKAFRHLLYEALHIRGHLHVLDWSA